VRFYKFLRAGAISPFSGVRWTAPGGDERGEPLSPGIPALCRTGIHACRLRDLPYWLSDELWIIELDGQIVESDVKVVAPAGRLVEHIKAWDKDLVSKFGMFCVVRAAFHAADELRDAGLAEHGRRLAEVAARAAEAGDARPGAAQGRNHRDHAPFGALDAAASEGMEQAARQGALDASALCGLARDAVELFEKYPPAMMAYVAVRAADARTQADGDPLVEERRRQSDWLAERLKLGP
jgi:hypothetical protein